MTLAGKLREYEMDGRVKKAYAGVVGEAADRIEQLQGALEWYGDEDIYKRLDGRRDGPKSYAERDYGKRAREALKGIEDAE